MRRHAVGLLAIVLLLTAGVLYLRGETTTESAEQLLAAAFRMGVLLSLLWVAYPELSRLRPWVALSIVAASFVVLRWPRLLIPVALVLIAMAILRPRNRRGGRPRDRENERPGEKEVAR